MKHRSNTELFSALCLTPMRRLAIEQARAAADGMTDYHWLFDQASRWEVTAVVMSNLAQLEIPSMSDEVRNRAASENLLERARIIGKVLRTSGLLELFDNEGIDSIVLKGPATGVTAYGDPSLRSFADLDLLIRETDIPSARDLLMRQEFEPHFRPEDEKALLREGHALEFMHPTLKVELHTELLSSYLGVRLSPDNAWTTSRVVRCADRNIRVLSPEVEFVFLAAHGAKHGWAQLRWVCDIAQLALRLTDAEIQNVSELARTLHCRKLVSLALQLAHDAFSVSLPPALEEMRNAFDTTSIARGVLWQFQLYDLAPPIRRFNLARVHAAMPGLFFWISTRERMSDRIQPFLSLLFRRR